MTEPKTVNITPSPRAYANMLRLIVDDSTNPKDRLWAREELVRIQPAIEAGHWVTLADADRVSLEGSE